MTARLGGSAGSSAEVQLCRRAALPAGAAPTEVGRPVRRGRGVGPRIFSVLITAALVLGSFGSAALVPAVRLVAYSGGPVLPAAGPAPGPGGGNGGGSGPAPSPVHHDAPSSSSSGGGSAPAPAHQDAPSAGPSGGNSGPADNAPKAPKPAEPAGAGPNAQSAPKPKTPAADGAAAQQPPAVVAKPPADPAAAKPPADPAAAKPPAAPAVGKPPAAPAAVKPPVDPAAAKPPADLGIPPNSGGPAPKRPEPGLPGPDQQQGGAVKPPSAPLAPGAGPQPGVGTPPVRAQPAPVNGAAASTPQPVPAGLKPVGAAAPAANGAAPVVCDPTGACGPPKKPGAAPAGDTPQVQTACPDAGGACPLRKPASPGGTAAAPNATSNGAAWAAMGVGAFKMFDGGLGVAEGDAAAETGIGAPVGLAFAATYAAVAAEGAREFGGGFDTVFGHHPPSTITGPATDPGMTVHAAQPAANAGSSEATNSTNDEAGLDDTRRKAFRDAKRDLGIPAGEPPDSIDRVALRDRNENLILDENGQRIMTRQYRYTRPGKEPREVVVQEHSAGHQYGENGVGDQGPHFNVRPKGDERTGKVPGTEEHYPFER